MEMRIFILLFFITSVLAAQKVVKKTIVNPAISFIQVDAGSCFNVEIETTDTDEMTIEADIDGEYRKELLLNVKEEGATVWVSAGFQPNFKNPNDKLSAHKVVSIALKIKLPKYKDVNVFGTSTTVLAKGVYEKLKITLNDGACRLSKVSGLIEVITQSGTITVASEAATITSTSKYGSIDGVSIPQGDDQYILSTITGNILLKRIE